jgi:hypothetical protein
MVQQAQVQKSLLDELGLSDLPQDKQEQLVIRMTEVILKRIFLETMEHLDEQGKEEYAGLVEGGAKPEQVEEFLNSKIQNYDTLIQKIVEEFKEEMKKGI